MDANRTPLVAGNWKMHGSRSEMAQLLDGIVGRLPARPAAECLVCPPFVYVESAVRRLAGTGVAVGAQNVSAEAVGAYTGEVSAAMLRDVGCTHVIVGHSERRALYGEDDALVARKMVAALGAGLTPIVCVGEQLAERERGETTQVVGRQIAAALAVLDAASLARIVVAYEPVWAIGTGRTASPAQAQEVHAFVRQRLTAVDAKIGGSVRILYGGSVKAANAAELFAQPDVDGGLIGGASLKAEEFLAILAAAR